MANPFDHQRPTIPAAFLDRAADRKEFLQRVTGGRNLLLYGLRRRGKTSLILRVFADLPPRYVGVEADMLGANGAQDVADRILKGLADTGFAKTRRFAKWLSDRARELDEFEIHLSARGLNLRVRRHEDYKNSIPEAWRLLETIATDHKKTIVLNLDEFQDVMSLEGVTAQIRSLAQKSRKVQLVISGSEPSVLRGLQEDKKSPFYRQLTTMRVKGLSILDLREEAQRHLGEPLDDATVDIFHQAAGTNTRRVIQILRHHFELKDAEASVDAAMWENRNDYEQELRQVKTGNQRNVLYALARDRPRHPTGGDFLIRNRLGAPENVRKAIKALRALEILDEDNDFVDPLFRLYLVQQQPQ